MARAGREEPTRYRRGVGIMLLDPAKRVLVARRIDTPDAWQMPQGGIDAGETPPVAARRELGEEIGTTKAEIIAETGWLRYDLPAELRGRLWGGGYRGQEQKWFAMRFLGRDADIDIATAHPEFDAWKWVEAAKLPSLIVPFKRTLYQEVLRQLARVFEG